MPTDDGCLITDRVASCCKACGAESSTEHPTHVYQMKEFYCGRCCVVCNPQQKEWEAHAPVIGDQESLFKGAP